jgi:hypothetical protein
MPYTVEELITDAYKLSSLVSREFEDLQGYQLNDGLKWLNQLLADTAFDYGAIPYITTYYQFNGIPGQEKYYLRNLLDIQSCVFFIQAIRYEMKYITRKAYFNLPRANNISALPLSYTYERAPHGVNLFSYFYPQEPYVIQIVGNMYVNLVNLNQDLHVATADLGFPIMSLDDNFTLFQGQLTVNGIDLKGTYNAINNPPIDYLITENGSLLLDEGGFPITTEAGYINISFLPFTAIEVFANYINTGTYDGSGDQPLIPNVIAVVQGNRFLLQSAYGDSIQITSNGRNFATDYLVTENNVIIFSETDGAMVPENYAQKHNNEIAPYEFKPCHDECHCARCTQYNQYGQCNAYNGDLPSPYPAVTNPDQNQYNLFTQSGRLPQNPPVPSFNFGNINFTDFPLDQGYLLNTYYAMDQFWIDFWMYSLADRIDQMFDMETPQRVVDQLNIYRQRLIKDAETVDLSAKTISTLGHAVGINYAAANMGRGFTTSGF